MIRHIFISLIIVISAAEAREGMWLLDQIDDLNLDTTNLVIPVESIYHDGKPGLTQAIVNLGGGTAEFVSSDGLLLTNHHVAYGAVQRASTKGTDYLTHGFLAHTREEEIQAPGSTVKVLQRVEDVTEQVLAVEKDLKDPVEKHRAVKRKIREMIDEIEAQAPDISAQVGNMFYGRQYTLFVYKRFDDVRVVYMPPLSIGNYGADIDNWMWPRHTGDFAFMRVYMSPEGEGRDYHPDNVPYHPEKWLKVAQHDLSPGDFTMIIGFPGRTNRVRTSYAVNYYQHYSYPALIRSFEEAMAELNRVGDTSPEAAIKVARRIKGLSNYHKKSSGILEGMEKVNFLDEKRQYEQALQEYIESRWKLRRKYGDLLTNMEQLYGDLIADFPRDNVLSRFRYLAGTLTSTATDIVYTVKEREKPEAERDPDFSEQENERKVERLPYRYYDLYLPAETALLNLTLQAAESLESTQRIGSIDDLMNRLNMSPQKTAETFLEKTQLTDPQFAQDCFTKTSDELKKINDPLLNFALALYDDLEDYRDRHEAFSAHLMELRQRYMEVVEDFEGRIQYPDANGTMRLTYGPVLGYQPRDAVTYAAQTTLKGVVEKNTGKVPFNAPLKLLDLYEQKDYGDWSDPSLSAMPIAFTHECDITNGNSGSPVLNAWGELVGIAFDGNYEALLSDWKYNPVIQRAISVDIRYVLFITEKYAGADFLLEEMGVE